jgi:protein SCO1
VSAPIRHGRLARVTLGLLGLACAALFVPRAAADLKPVAARVGVSERLGRALPLDLRVTDHAGRSSVLGSVLGGERPILLALAYYHCPGLCDLSLRQLATALRGMSFELGRDYQALTVSIDPKDQPPSAAAKRGSVLALLHRETDWPFFVASAGVIGTLTDALGYQYDYDARTKQYAHPAVSMVLTPQGRISRYLYGPTYDVRSLQLALREARAGRTSATALVDRTILSCFQYDPSTRRYEWVVLGVMRIGATLIAALLAIAIIIFVRRGRARRGHP